jgi:hypothetical protein
VCCWCWLFVNCSAWTGKHWSVVTLLELGRS